jgi:hypothetical protein
MEAALMRLLAEMGCKSGDDALVDGLMRAIDEASDPLARSLDLWPTTDRPVAPTVFALALRALHATQTFQLKPAELRAEIVKAYRRLKRLWAALGDCYERRLTIEDVILLYGPQHDDATFKARRDLAARRAGLLPPEEEEAEAMETEETPALAACEAPTVKRRRKSSKTEEQGATKGE